MGSHAADTTATLTARRGTLVLFALYFCFAAISARLFYWQIIKGSELEQTAEDQYTRSITLTGARGTITTSDNFALVTNQEVFTVFAQPHIITAEPETVAQQLAQYIASDTQEYQEASSAAEQKKITDTLTMQLLEKLLKPARWVSLKHAISPAAKNAIADLQITGIGFDPHLKRAYPEASLSAHVLGFVGKNNEGIDTGYFGVEGALEKELRARSEKNTIVADALGMKLSAQKSKGATVNGKNITLTIRRDVQNLIEKELAAAIQKYQAKSGEIIVMQPQTGKILGLAAYPTYNPSEFHRYSAEYYKNPTLSDLYEPGSTFKALTVAIGIEEGVITPETTCDVCDKPRVFGKYSIGTWNDVYTPNITMKEALAKSDNTAMIFIAEKIGSETFQTHLKKLGIAQKVGIDLQEDRGTPFPNDWNPVKLATVSFGQGIAVNSMQLTKAFNAIVNNGILVQPSIVESVTDSETGEVITHPIVTEGRVFSKETARITTEMLVEAAQQGEAQWTASDTYLAAGKTGTSQVVTEKGYDKEKTIASFIGFAPPQHPEFVLLVKLVEPKTSIWAAETAAPVWHTISRKLHLLLNIAL